MPHQYPPTTYLARIRLHRYLTLEPPAQAAGIHERFLGYIERRQRRANPEIRKALAEFYGTTVKHLFEGDYARRLPGGDPHGGRPTA